MPPRIVTSGYRYFFSPGGGGHVKNLVPAVMSGHTQFLGDITKLGYIGYDMVKLDHMSGTCKKLRKKLNSTILKKLDFLSHLYVLVIQYLQHIIMIILHDI